MRRIASPYFFSESVEADDWTLFHGTSSAFASEIQENGLRPHASAAAREMVDRVVAVVKAIDWIPTSAVPLISYSQGFDFADGDSPLFLAETSLRAALCASDDFAGAEKLSRVRKTINDLTAFLENEELREEHYAIKRQAYQKAKVIMHPDHVESHRPKIVDLEWLSAQLEGLGDVRLLAEQAWEEHSHGVVFAFRLKPADADQMVWHRSMGIMSKASIPCDRIVAKALVPLDFDHRPRSDPYRRQFQEKAIASALRPWTIGWSAD